MDNYSTRNSSFEIMRIAAMFMVIIGHCTLATSQNQEPYLGVLDMTGWCIKAFTVCAVNLFFMLTGYYAQPMRFKASRIIDIWIKTIFYSVIIYTVISVGRNEFSIKEVVPYFLPVLTKKYWYIQTYIVLSFCAPYIINGFQNVSRKGFYFILVVLLFFFSFHETFIKTEYTLDRTSGYGIVWAVVMLIVGYWLKNIETLICRMSKWVYLFGYFAISVFIFISNYLIVKYDIAGGVVSRGNFYGYNSLSCMAQSVCLFCVFVKISKTIKTSTVVNWVSRNVLAAYLISAHPLLLYPLWTDYLKMDRFTESIPLYVGMVFLFSIIVLFFCITIDAIIEKILIRLGKRTLMNKIDRLYNLITKY